MNCSMALTVIFVTLGHKVYAKDMLSVLAVLIGLLARPVFAFALGEVRLANAGCASPFVLPSPLHFGRAV